MIRSMTGFGDAEGDTPAGRLRLEVKTVNHRFFNTSIKTPSGFDKYEKPITDALKEHIGRGHVNVFLSLDRTSAELQPGPSIDIAKARGYQAALESLKDALDLPGNADLALMSRFGDIFRAPEADRTAGVEVEAVADLAAKAASACRDMREAFLAEKWDINEEIVRFRSHIELFQEALEGDATEPVGKRLGFLVQEMHREANTVGSKANDAEVAQASVAIKEEIERLREQIENVE